MDPRLRFVRLVALASLSACAAGAPPPVEVRIGEASVVAASAPEARGPNAVALDPKALRGRWEGVGHQESGASWAMVVDLEEPRIGACGRVVYPGIPCAAEWTCVEVGPRAVRAREHVTEGQDACIDGGDLTLVPTREGNLAWSWRGEGEAARALLRRAPTDARP
jgi:hypothetical protein